MRPTKNTAPRGAKKAAAPPMDEAAMRAMWQEAMTPADGHRRLEPMIGSWNAKMTFWMAPGTPPQSSEGTSEHRWVLGGRYLEQAYTGTSMGMPFEGLGYTGYDNCRRKYVGTWMDNFGTGIMFTTGVGKPSDTEITSESDMVEPSGRQVHFTCKARIQDHDHHSFEMWTKAPNGRRYRTMLVEYTRR